LYYETVLIKTRHDELVAEMIARGFQHRTPLVYRDALNAGHVDRAASRRVLHERCAECRALWDRVSNEGGSNEQ
jgi:hypothetical protein